MTVLLCGSSQTHLGTLMPSGGGHIIKAVVYVRPPFGDPEPMLAYLSGYTHRIAISNSRLISADASTEAFRWKGYRIKRGDSMKVIQLKTRGFIRRYLIHVLPDGFHRIRR